MTANGPATYKITITRVAPSDSTDHKSQRRSTGSGRRRLMYSAHLSWCSASLWGQYLSLSSSGRKGQQPQGLQWKPPQRHIFTADPSLDFHPWRPELKEHSSTAHTSNWFLINLNRTNEDCLEAAVSCVTPVDILKLSEAIFPLMPGVVFVRVGLISSDEVELTATETLQLPDWIKVYRRDGDTIQSSPQKNCHLWGKALVPDRRCFIGRTSVAERIRLRQYRPAKAAAAALHMLARPPSAWAPKGITEKSPWRRCFGTRPCCPSARSVTLQRAAQMLFRRVSSCRFLEVNSR